LPHVSFLRRHGTSGNGSWKESSEKDLPQRMQRNAKVVSGRKGW
jgi:hypothetical protein